MYPHSGGRFTGHSTRQDSAVTTSIRFRPSQAQASSTDSVLETPVYAAWILTPRLSLSTGTPPWYSITVFDVITRACHLSVTGSALDAHPKVQFNLIKISLQVQTVKNFQG